MSLILSILLSILFQVTKEKLLFSYQLFRHGARAPVFYKDNHQDYYDVNWSENAGELTPSGERQHYILGNIIGDKLRKAGLIGDIYNPRDFLVYSPDINRTMQSAYSQFRGIFQKSSSLFNNQTQNAIPPNQTISDAVKSEITALNDQPLPNYLQAFPVIETQPDSKYDLFSNCGHKGLAYKNLLENMAYIEPIEEKYYNEHALQYVETFKKTLNDTNPYDYTPSNFSVYFGNAYVALDFNGYSPQLDYLKFNMTEFNETMKTVDHFYFLQIDHNRKRSQVFMTPSVKKVIKLMDKRIENEDSIKVFFMSSHDTNIQFLVNFITVAFDFKYEVGHIYFASNLEIELHQNETDNSYFVNIHYNQKPVKLNIPYSEFKKKMLDHAVSNEYIKEFCGESTPDKNSHKHRTLYIVLICVFSVIIAICIAIIIYIIVRWRKSRVNYTQL